MKTALRSGDVLSLFDRLGDAFKNDRAQEGQSERKSGLDGNAKLGVDAELDGARARGGPAREPGEPAKRESAREPQREARDPARPPAPDASPKDRARAPGTAGTPAGARPPGAHPEPRVSERGEARAAGRAPAEPPAGRPGFVPSDRARGPNAAESANVARYLQDPGVPTETKELRSWKGALRKDDAGSDFVQIGGRRDRKTEERKREDRADELRQAFVQELKRGEVRETREGRELERPHVEEALGEELGTALGNAWTMERPHEEAAPREGALRVEDALGELFRCRGVLEDGSRCLMKPLLGIPYCREHAALLPSAGADPAVVQPEAMGADPLEAVSTSDATDPNVAALADDADPYPEEPGAATDPDVPAFVVTD